MATLEFITKEDLEQFKKELFAELSGHSGAIGHLIPKKRTVRSVTL